MPEPRRAPGLERAGAALAGLLVLAAATPQALGAEPPKGAPAAEPPGPSPTAEPAAITTTEPVAGSPEHQWQAARAALMDRGDLPACRRHLHALVETAPEHGLADDALWLLAHLERHLGRWDRARQYLAVLAHDRHGASWVVGSYRNHRQRPAALWRARLTWIAEGPTAAARQYQALWAADAGDRWAETAAYEGAWATAAAQGPDDRPELPGAADFPAAEPPGPHRADWIRVDLAALARDVGW